MVLGNFAAQKFSVVNFEAGSFAPGYFSGENFRCVLILLCGNFAKWKFRSVDVSLRDIFGS